MTENLLTPSVIKLFGRVMNDLKFNYDPSTVVTGFNNLLQRQLYNGYSGPYQATVAITDCTVYFDSTTGISKLTVIVNPSPPVPNNISINPAYSVTGLASRMQIIAATGTPPVGPNISILDQSVLPAYPIVTSTNINYNPFPPPLTPPPPLPPPYTTTTTGSGLFSVNIPFIVPQTSLPAVPIPAPIASPPPPPPLSNRTFLITDVSITATTPDQLPRLARIYGFSFEGTYYGLPRPSIFLIHGPGTPAGNWATNSTMEQAGVAAREWDFSGNELQDIAYWEYEKSDFSIRLDPEAGPLEQILLAAALRTGADMADRATPRSGASLSGASVSGASLSGASLSGASLSGASLSGASLRR
jgi:hypothetical protein